MSFNQITSTLIKGASYAVGAKVGRELYDVAADRVRQVDWQKLRQGAASTLERVGVAAGFVDPEPAPPEADEPGEDAAEPARWVEPEFIERTL